MGELKPVIADRHNAWEAAQTRGGSSSRSQPESPSRELSRRPSNASQYYDRDRTPSRQSNPGSSNTAVQIWYPPAAVEAHEKRMQEDVMRIRAVTEQRTRSEQVGIIQRQRAAEEEAAAARRSASATPRPGPVTISPARPVNISRTLYDASYEVPQMLPLESPTRYESDSAENEVDDNLYKRIANMSVQNRRQSPAPPAPPFGTYVANASKTYEQQQAEPFSLRSFYPPITTTSPPPPTLTKIRYPELMSQHQRTQGYSPSLQSMFIQPAAAVPQSNLLFEHAPPSNLYNNILPPQSHAVSYTSKRSGTPQPSSSDYAYPYSNPTPAEPPRPMIPPKPAPEPPAPRLAPPPPEPASRSSSSSKVNGERRDPVKHSLKTVNVPRDILPRFLSIASLNTSLNRETCGLLLGKTKGEKFVVTTLLIPKQHSTSDTCTMDEEELVLEFTEQRSLITLGWVRSHALLHRMGFS
jgi:STAM-binding protein